MVKRLISKLGKKNFVLLLSASLVVKVVGFFLFSSIILDGCKKYDEGPAISFRSIEKRFLGEWVKTECTSIDMEDVSQWTVNFEEGGKFTETITLASGDVETLTGTWSFTDKKESVLLIFTYRHIAYNNGNTWQGPLNNWTNEWFIFKMKKKEMMIKSYNGDKEYGEFEATFGR